MNTLLETQSPSVSSFQFARRTAGLRPSAIREILKTTESADIISFAGGLPAPELFPVEAMRAAAHLVLTQDGPAALQYSVTEGYGPLRHWVSNHLLRSAGLTTPPERILITHGSQQGLDLIAKILLDPSDIVVVENPAYLGALQAFQAYEARVVGVTGDSQGILPDALEQCLKACPRRPKFLYLIPNFQNPTGTSLAAERRASIASLSARFGVPIVEDDPYGELRFCGTAAPALSALASGSDCIYLGTASKILAPGLRVAWLAAPNPAVFEKLVTVKQATDLHTSSFTQRLVWEVVKNALWLEDHVATLRRVYGKRRDTMLTALENYLPTGCTWTQPDGGLFLWVRTPAQVDTLHLLRVAMRENLAFVPGAPFWVNAEVNNTLRLNFSNADEGKIIEGIKRLGAALATLR